MRRNFVYKARYVLPLGVSKVLEIHLFRKKKKKKNNKKKKKKKLTSSKVMLQ